MGKEKKSIGIVCSDIYMRFPEIMEEEFDDLLEFLEDEHIRCEGATDVFMDLQKENKHLEQQCKKQKEVINKAIALLNNPWSFESGNKEVDEITYNKKRKVIDVLKEVSE